MRIEWRGGRKERGSVLLHVLVTGVVVALIAASIMRMTLLRYQMNARSANILIEKRLDQGGLATVIAGWNQSGIICANNVANYACAPASVAAPGTCGCTCTPTAVLNPPLPNVTSAVVGGACQLSIGASTDLP